MTIPRILAIFVLALLPAIPAAAQSAADLFQKGIHAQEAAGDLDSAIQIYRQVSALGGNNRPLAAQAQYQLVLCMLQKGDRSAAVREVDSLARNFPDQSDLISKARKLIPGNAPLLPAPWGEAESSQLNIKRNGTFTGETLYYSIDPFFADSSFNRQSNPQAQALLWEFNTGKTRRSVFFNVDRTTMQPLGEAVLRLDDSLGDPAAALLSGPAIDSQQSVFLLRRLPLAPGFKSTMTSLPLVIGQTAAKELEFAVTGIEPVQVVAGKFNCFKVVFASIGQTFWIGVDGARPLVKMQAAGVEAELVKAWGPENILDAALAPVLALGWKTDGEPRWYPGRTRSISIKRESAPGRTMAGANVTATRIYTPAGQIEQMLRERVKASIEDSTHFVRADSIQPRTVGGRQAISWWVDTTPNSTGASPIYHAAIASENAMIEFTVYGSALSRWLVDPAIEATRLP